MEGSILVTWAGFLIIYLSRQYYGRMLVEQPSLQMHWSSQPDALEFPAGAAVVWDNGTYDPITFAIFLTRKLANAMFLKGGEASTREESSHARGEAKRSDLWGPKLPFSGQA